MGQIHAALWGLALVFGSPGLLLSAAKPHVVVLGPAKKVPYSIAGDPAGAAPYEKELHVRPLIVDAKIKDWTTGEAHDVTDRSFAVRRAIRLNDALPTEKAEHWVWQRGPWLLVDRATATRPLSNSPTTIRRFRASSGSATMLPIADSLQVAVKSMQ